MPQGIKRLGYQALEALACAASAELLAGGLLEFCLEKRLFVAAARLCRRATTANGCGFAAEPLIAAVKDGELDPSLMASALQAIEDLRDDSLLDPHFPSKSTALASLFRLLIVEGRLRILVDFDAPRALDAALLFFDTRLFRLLIDHPSVSSSTTTNNGGLRRFLATEFLALRPRAPAAVALFLLAASAKQSFLEEKELADATQLALILAEPAEKVEEILLKALTPPTSLAAAASTLFLRFLKHRLPNAAAAHAANVLTSAGLSPELVSNTYTCEIDSSPPSEPSLSELESICLSEFSQPSSLSSCEL